MHSTEWEYTKRQYNYSCPVCGMDERISGVRLMRTHVFAKSKGGGTVIPMCPNCHAKFDAGRFDDFELSKIGVTREEYGKALPLGRTTPKRSEGDLEDVFDVSDVQKQVRDFLE